MCVITHREFVVTHTHTHPGWGKIVGTFLVQCSTMHCVVKPTDRVLSQLGPIQCKGVGKKVWNLNLCVCATTLIILPMFILSMNLLSTKYLFRPWLILSSATLTLLSDLLAPHLNVRIFLKAYLVYHLIDMPTSLDVMFIQ